MKQADVRAYDPVCKIRKRIFLKSIVEKEYGGIYDLRLYKTVGGLWGVKSAY